LNNIKKSFNFGCSSNFREEKERLYIFLRQLTVRHLGGIQNPFSVTQAGFNYGFRVNSTYSAYRKDFGFIVRISNAKEESVAESAFRRAPSFLQRKAGAGTSDRLARTLSRKGTDVSILTLLEEEPRD
jgi:hypothetical protein